VAGATIVPQIQGNITLGQFNSLAHLKFSQLLSFSFISFSSSLGYHGENVFSLSPSTVGKVEFLALVMQTCFGQGNGSG
jgi:hypothetical protein